MEGKNPQRLLIVLNIVALVATIVVNALANALPLNGMTTGALSDAIPNLFVPAGLTFAIWGPIYLLLVVFAIYQAVNGWKHDVQDTAVRKLGPWFIVSCVANALWIIAWHWQLIALSLIVMLFLLGALMLMYGKTRGNECSLGFRAAVSLPVSIYLGWITVATIANITSLLVTMQWDRFGLSEVFWTVAVLGAAIAINLLAIIISGDIWFAAVGIWALYGIYLKRSTVGPESASPIVLTSLVGMIVLGVAVAVHLIVKGRKVAKDGC